MAQGMRFDGEEQQKPQSDQQTMTCALFDSREGPDWRVQFECVKTKWLDPVFVRHWGWERLSCDCQAGNARRRRSLFDRCLRASARCRTKFRSRPGTCQTGCVSRVICIAAVRRFLCAEVPRSLTRFRSSHCSPTASSPRSSPAPAASGPPPPHRRTGSIPSRSSMSASPTSPASRSVKWPCVILGVGSRGGEAPAEPLAELLCGSTGAAPSQNRARLFSKSNRRLVAALARVRS